MLFEPEVSRQLREHMIEAQLLPRGIRDVRVLDAFRRVPREAFVPDDLAPQAYDDRALPIEHGQTISQPYIVARTLDALGLHGDERVLEIGTGTGYVAALLAHLARDVVSIERIPELAESSKARLARLGYAVDVRCGDGTLGCPERAPYDAIAVAASGPKVPRQLLEQLSPGGRIVIPVEQGERQVLTRVVKRGEEAVAEVLEEVRFVPLIGREGVAL